MQPQQRENATIRDRGAPGVIVSNSYAVITGLVTRCDEIKESGAILRYFIALQIIAGVCSKVAAV